MQAALSHDLAEVSASGSGWMVHSSVQQRGYVALQDLVSWFHLVQQTMQLGRYFDSAFEDVKHVFHQGERHR
jgi:hypothetical protein